MTAAPSLFEYILTLPSILASLVLSWLLLAPKLDDAAEPTALAEMEFLAPSTMLGDCNDTPSTP